MEMSRRFATRGESSNSQENSEAWGLIWNLEGPGVLKHFDGSSVRMHCQQRKIFADRR
jgi:hypothetical protein